MSSLSRYKKSGGFTQLLSLIETFGPQKKDKFLEMIQQESPTWERALREKMITFERIFTWPEQVVVEVFKQLQPKTLTFALQGLKPEQRDKILTYFSHAEKRRMDDILTESKPKPEEISSTLVKVVELTRKMLKERTLHADKFDPSLIVPEDYEQKLEELAAHETFAAMSSAPAGGPAPAPSPAPAASAAPTTHAKAAPAPKAEVNVDGTPVDAVRAGIDVIQLQKKVQELLRENKALKDENHALRGKLETIKKIA